MLENQGYIMGKKASDKKLNRLSTILEIITNLGTIASWVLGVGSAYLLNVQKTPVVVPGIDFTLDLGFQFALLVSAMLGYIHFLQKYWEKNTEKLKLSNSFTDFSLWDLPRLKQPLLLIPVVIAFAIFVQVSIKSYWLLTIFLLFLGLIIYFVIKRFSYHLSPQRKYEKLIQYWSTDNEWLERWIRRIKKQLDLYIGVRVRDLRDASKSYSDEGTLEIEFALKQYFERFEFEEDLVLTTVDELNWGHPYHSHLTDETILIKRKNLALHESGEK